MEPKFVYQCTSQTSSNLNSLGFICKVSEVFVHRFSSRDEREVESIGFDTNQHPNGGVKESWKQGNAPTR